MKLDLKKRWDLAAERYMYTWHPWTTRNLEKGTVGLMNKEQLQSEECEMCLNSIYCVLMVVALQAK